MRRRVLRVMLGVGLAAIAACTSAPVAPPPPVPPPRPQPLALRPAVPPPPAPLRPEQLIGLSGAQALALLGPPAARSTRDMATVWRYRRGGCVLSLLLYPEVGTQVERVLGTEAEGGTAASCLTRLRQERTRHGQ